MRYLIDRPTVDTPATDAALQLLLQHAKTITATYVTVAAPYKPVRLVRCCCDVPNQFAVQARRTLAGLLDTDMDAVQTTTDIIPKRPEWTELVLLRPTPEAEVLDGRILAAAASAQLIVWHRPGRCAAQLLLSEHDQPVLAQIAAAGWEIQRNPSWSVRLQAANGAPWSGVPSLQTVPRDPPAAPATVAHDPTDLPRAAWLRGVLATTTSAGATHDDNHHQVTIGSETN